MLSTTSVNNLFVWLNLSGGLLFTFWFCCTFEIFKSTFLKQNSQVVEISYFQLTVQ
eukprot:TRINITY_DN1345_c0_g1_i2.p3 TRINITY_DN1345_c0_g1~~TRINITY_DN1345_c0_g1_i2.p3  ORF type:complete len:56 (-),score=2.08 TRINITY_DN1345_c0_g1_i2:184-351(-)